ncbi:MAG TPA: hypothetical protein PLU88_05195 [Armatimonadota bacterium]|nr:hypothetical protein [Armatimonadota bacterium]HPP74505.1 hypothetical protein [Armatimonadota bacterium]
MRLVIVGVIAILMMAAAAGAVTMDTDLVGDVVPLQNTGTVIPLHAESNWTGTVWEYTYTIEITNSSRPITGFSVQNLGKFAFTNAWNDKNFVNPASDGSDSLFWNSGYVMPAEGPISFGFQSVYAPGTVDVSLFGGARNASGVSLGMVIPEPASMASLACLGLGGVFAVLRRKRP